MLSPKEFFGVILLSAAAVALLVGAVQLVEDATEDGGPVYPYTPTTAIPSIYQRPNYKLNPPTVTWTPRPEWLNRPTSTPEVQP